jgi:hypothetical protein
MPSCSKLGQPPSELYAQKNCWEKLRGSKPSRKRLAPLDAKQQENVLCKKKDRNPM